MTPPRLSALALAALLGAGCGATSDRSGGRCSAPQLTTVQRGTLTLSTGAVTRAPWVSGTAEPGRSPDPRDGMGYDAAVGYALAERLGFDQKHVRWVATPFTEVLKGGPKDFDVNVNQVTVRPDRQATVSLSRPYYRARSAVVTVDGRPVEEVTSLDGLRGRSFAVVAGSPAQFAAAGLTVTPYPDLEAVRRAVASGASDAMLVDYPTALRLDGDESLLVGGELVGVLGAPPADAEAYGLVLAHGSRLTACVDEALAAMERDGTLLALEKRWLVEEPGWHWLE